ncbi:MAG: ABC transporter ATP-binding protein [Leptospirales bacterium]|nr:ABC transporter ATP-binding protein [Leptospirales bacterium]
MTALIEVQNAVRSFGAQRAVDGVSFTVAPGEIYGLIGPDGAGKTTMLRLLVGALEADQGDVRVGGEDLRRHADRARARIGYMPQAFGLYGDLSVAENIRFLGQLQGIPRALREKRAAELLQFVRLEEFSNRPAAALSGGMYKKLAIACALIHEPSVLILDEPTNGVDPVSRRELWALIFELSTRGVATLVSTPYMDEAERCDRTGLLWKGQLLREGRPADLLGELEGRIFRCQPDDRTGLPELVQKLQALGPPVTAAYIAGQSAHLIIDQRRHSTTLRSALPRGVRRDTVAPSFEDLFMHLQSGGAT